MRARGEEALFRHNVRVLFTWHFETAQGTSALIRLAQFRAVLCAGIVLAGHVAPLIEGYAQEDALKAAEQPIVRAASERVRIEEAVPRDAIVRPTKPRKLLVFDLNVGYGGHASIAHANYAFKLMGDRTGAYRTVISRDPSVFKPESLRQFDAVFFNNTVGDLFEDQELRQSLVQFVYGGGGLLGIHGASVAFTRWPGAHEDWPEFGIMLGARGANHRDSDEHVVIKLDDPGHPLNRPFAGQGFEYRDEFFRVHEPYSRERVRVLFSIDTEKTETRGQARGNVLRSDNDYALAWVRNYGRGRVFYCTIAHNPYVFWDPKLLQFYLGAIQFALGDLPAPTLPSSRLTAAIRAHEKLGWRLGLDATAFPKATLFEAIDKAAALGVAYLGGLSSQKVSQQAARDFNEHLTEDERRQVRLKLDSAGVRLLTYSLARMPPDEAGCHKVFEFARKMGIETIISGPPAALEIVERLCNEFDLNFAIRYQDGESTPQLGRPDAVAKMCQGRSPHIGVCGNVPGWVRSGVDPINAAQTLRTRLITVQIASLNEPGHEGHGDWRTSGDAQTARFLKEIRRLGVQPTMFGLDYAGAGLDRITALARCSDLFNNIALELIQ
jgi:hypothetical protein